MSGTQDSMAGHPSSLSLPTSSCSAGSWQLWGLNGCGLRVRKGLYVPKLPCYHSIGTCRLSLMRAPCREVRYRRGHGLHNLGQH